MTDETGATGTQADPETQPPAGDAEAQAAPATEQAQQETISLDEAKKLRSEANGLRRRLKELEDADKARKDAELSETDRLTARVTEMEAAAQASRDRILRLATVGVASRLGFTDPEDAVRLIDTASLEVGDDGTPANADAVLAALAKAKPYLLTQRTIGSFDSGTGGAKSSPRAYTREQLRDPKFYAANEADILAAMREGRIAN